MYHKHIMVIVNDDGKWCMYYKCVIALALALVLAFADAVNYDRKWCHNLERHSLMTLRGVIYNRNMVMIQAIALAFQGQTF